MKKTIKALDLFVCSYDVRIDNALLELCYSADEPLTRGELCVALDLLQRGHTNSFKYAAIPQLALDCGMSERSIIRALSSLKARGLIEYEHRQGDRTPALILLKKTGKGFTDIPRAAFRACMERIAAHEMTLPALRLLVFAWRNTYGYKGKRRNDYEPINERVMKDVYIMHGMGVTHKRNLYKALGELSSYGAITIKHIEEWKSGQKLNNVRKVVVNSVWIPEKKAVVKMSCDTVVNMSVDPVVNMSCDEKALETSANIGISAGNDTDTPKISHDKNTTIRNKDILNKDCLNKDAAAAAPSLDNTHTHICLEEAESPTKSREKTLEQLRAEAREYIANCKPLTAESTEPSRESVPVSDHKPMTALEMLNAMSEEERAELKKVPSYFMFTADTPSATPAEIYDFEDMKRYAAIHGTLEGFTASRATPSEPGVIADCI